MFSKVTGLGFRVLTLGSKFLMSIFIVEFLGLEKSGEYGLFFTSLTIFSYIIGLDFYSYSTREILINKSNSSEFKIKNQFIFFSFLYIVLFFLLYPLSVFKLIPNDFIFLFYIILITEHFSTELYRLHVTFQQQVYANINLFLRSGIWILALLIFWYLNIQRLINLESVYLFWLTGNFISIVFSVLFLKKVPLNIKNAGQWNWEWVKKGVIISIPFFVTTLSLKLMQLADRYLIDWFLDSKIVGVYLFYANIANVVETVTQATIIMYYSPRLIYAVDSDMPSYKRLEKEFKKKVVWGSVIVSLIMAGVAMLIFAYLKKEELYDNKETLFVLLFSKVIFNFSLVYHYYLYGLKKDLSLLTGTLCALVVNLSLNIILIPLLGIFGCALASVTGTLILLILKYFSSLKYGYKNIVLSSK